MVFFNILFAVVLSTTFRHNVLMNCLLHGFPPYVPEFIESNALHPRSLAQIYFVWLRSYFAEEIRITTIIPILDSCLNAHNHTCRWRKSMLAEAKYTIGQLVTVTRSHERTHSQSCICIHTLQSVRQSMIVTQPHSYSHELKSVTYSRGYTNHTRSHIFSHTLKLVSDTHQVSRS
jgi:hypothetical protein